MEPTGKPFQMKVQDVQVGEPAQEGYLPVTLVTSRGTISYRYYEAPGARCGAIWVGGVGGGWDTPSRSLYFRLCHELLDASIASLRVRLRHPTILGEAILDVLAGINFLRSRGLDTIALTGWSFGGAVALQAAAISQFVRTVVTLSTQGYGVDPIARLGPRCSVLLIHGTGDQVLPQVCSEHAYQLAQEPKRLLLYEGANHALDEVSEEVHLVVHDWIVEQLHAATA